MEPERANKAIRLPTSRSLRDNKAKCGYQYRHLANTLIEGVIQGCNGGIGHKKFRNDRQRIVHAPAECHRLSLVYATQCQTERAS